MCWPRTFDRGVGVASSQRYLQLTTDMVSEITRRHARRFGHLISEGEQT